MEKTIALNQIHAMRENFLNDPQRCARMSAVTKVGINDSAENFLAPVHTPNTFSVEITPDKIVSQNHSGRCWLFAAMNVMRSKVIRSLNLEPEFELSQSYLFFWDKLEKANHFLENVLRTLDRAQDDRLINWMLTTAFEDGGQWDMAVGIIEKYGVCPKTVMPESFSSSNSAAMDKMLTLKGRIFAKELRDGYRAGKSIEELSQRKEAMLQEIFNILCISLGTPPETFDFEIRDKDRKFIRDEGLTPVEFFHKYVDMDLSQYVSLINAPTADKPFYETFTVDYLGSVEGGKPILYLNLPVEELKAAARKQLESDEPVWFGSDVGQMHNRKNGLMSMEAFDYNTLLCADFALDKGARLDSCESLMTHAMVLTGVNVQNGKTNRWKVENRWGTDAGVDGWFRMDDNWFSEYVYQVVINKKFLTDEQLKALEKQPHHLNPWDPMGSLA